MANILFGDFETRGVLDLRVHGLWNYARHPSTEPYCLGYAFDDENPQLWWKGDPLPDRVRRHIADGGTFVAHNAQFELAIWNEVMVKQYGWPELKPEQVICTMARCYAMAFPGALDDAAPALGMGEVKDKAGHTLMMRMCAPTNKKAVLEGADPKWLIDQPSFTFLGEKRTPEWARKRLGAYCIQDVVVERGIYKRTMPLSSRERRVWQVDYRINQRGVLFDPKAVAGALKIKEEAVKNLDDRMRTLTDGTVQTCSALIPLKKWIQDFGVFVDSLAKDALQELIDDKTIHQLVRKALHLRQEAGRATSVAKLDKAAALADIYGRIHYLFQYHGAGTGRWAGRGLQPHNFPRDLPKPEAVEGVMKLIRDGDRVMLEALEGPALTVISKLLRAFIIAAPGKKLIGGDWSNVEGRGLAWLAGEDWKVEAFRECDSDPDLPDMYERAYAKTFNVNPASVSDAGRQLGKVQELASGYQGAVGAYRQMGGAKVAHLSDAEIVELVQGWRKGHPMTVQYWYALENAAKLAVMRPGQVVGTADKDLWCKSRWVKDKFGDLPPPPRDRQIKFKVSKPGPFLWALLPSGRTICYPYPKIIEGKLTYMSVPSADDWKRGRVIPWPGNARNWARLGTYGGKLAENVTQAVCRDFLSEFLVASEEAGYETVLHVHDDAVEEGLFTEEDRARIQHMMCTPPPWAPGFPLKAECWISKRYQK